MTSYGNVKIQNFQMNQVHAVFFPFLRIAAMNYMNMSSIEGYQMPQFALFSDLDWRRPDLTVYQAQTRRELSPWFQVEFQMPVIVGTINFVSSF